MIHRSSHDEQQVREPIQVDDQNGIDSSAAKGHDAALGSAADGSRQMQQRTRAGIRREE
jgi:hypothetical protein